MTGCQHVNLINRYLYCLSLVLNPIIIFYLSPYITQQYITLTNAFLHINDKIHADGIGIGMVRTLQSYHLSR